MRTKIAKFVAWYVLNLNGAVSDAWTEPIDWVTACQVQESLTAAGIESTVQPLSARLRAEFAARPVAQVAAMAIFRQQRAGGEALVISERPVRCFIGGPRRANAI